MQGSLSVYTAFICSNEPLVLRLGPQEKELAGVLEEVWPFGVGGVFCGSAPCLCMHSDLRSDHTPLHANEKVHCLK